MYDISEELQCLHHNDLFRRLKTVSTASGPCMQIDGRTVLMMASNDYLGLCSSERVKKAVQSAVLTWGAGSGSARLISGNSSLFEKLECRLAEFKQTEAALVFSTGYMANTGILSALGSSRDAVFSDELNHASIIDGCRLSRARTEIYRHCNTAHLAELLAAAMQYRRRIIVSDGVFSMDGDCAPVPELVSLAEHYDAILIIDDAHGTGCLGARGRGVLEHFHLTCSPRIVIMGTLGKALGGFGAFVACTSALRDYFVNRARSFIFTTALPPAVTAAAVEAISIIDDEPGLLGTLQDNAAYMRRCLQQLGFDTGRSRTQIIPIMIGEPRQALDVSADLFRDGIFLLAIRPPAVPADSARLRLTVMATHTRADLDRAIESLERNGKRHGII